MEDIAKRSAPFVEIRLLTLYILKRFGSVSEMTLLYFLADFDLMNYIDLSIALGELCKQGHAVRVQKGADFDYTVTPAGYETLDMFVHRIPKSKLDLVDNEVDGFVQKRRILRERKSKIENTPRGEKIVSLSLEEQDVKLVDISFTVPNAEFAQKLSKNWEERAGDVYASIVDLLLKE